MGNMVSPGFAIFKSWQGIVEMILRVACMVLSFILLFYASVVMGELNDIADIEYDNSGRYRAAAGWLIFVAVTGMLIQTTIIFVRFLNITFINQNFIIFGFIDIVNSVVFALSLFAGGTANAAYSADNADIYDDVCNRDNLNNDQQAACDSLETVRNAEGASAAFAYFAMVAYGLLALIILFVLITQYINKTRSSDPSLQYQESSGPKQEPTS